MMMREKLVNTVRSTKTCLKGSPVFWQSMANYTERVWGLGYSMILARLILPEEFGMFAYGMGISQMAALLTRWEVGNLVRADPYYQEEGFHSVWSLTKILALAESIVVVLVALVCFLLGVDLSVCVVIGVYGVLTAIDKFPVVLRCDLEGRSHFKSNLIVKLWLPPLAAAITIPLALMGFGVWALIASSGVAMGLNWFVYSRANKRKIEKTRVEYSLIRKVVQPSFWIWMNFISHAIFLRGDKVVVGASEGSENLGYYSRAYNYSPLSFMALGALAGGPAIVTFRNLNCKRARLRVYFKRVSLMSAAGLFFAAIWLLWADLLVPFLFGDNWLSAVIYFKYFAFFGVVQAWYFLSNSLLQGCRKFKAQGLIKLGCIAVAGVVLSLMTVNVLTVAIVLQTAMLMAGLAMLIYYLISKKITHNQ